ncbi:MAG: hypothetical protein ACBR15_13320 [Microcoleus sp.]
MTKRSRRNAVNKHFCESKSVRAAINSIGSSIDRTHSHRFCRVKIEGKPLARPDVARGSQQVIASIWAT